MSKEYNNTFKIGDRVELSSPSRTLTLYGTIEGFNGINAIVRFDGSTTSNEIDPELLGLSLEKYLDKHGQLVDQIGRITYSFTYSTVNIPVAVSLEQLEAIVLHMKQGKNLLRLEKENYEKYYK